MHACFDVFKWEDIDFAGLGRLKIGCPGWNAARDEQGRGNQPPHTGTPRNHEGLLPQVLYIQAP
jgi:hypothetical protein